MLSHLPRHGKPACAMVSGLRAKAERRAERRAHRRQRLEELDTEEGYSDPELQDPEAEEALVAAEEADEEAELDFLLRSDAEFVGSEQQWQQLGREQQLSMAMDAIARRREGLAKWQQRRQAMLEGMSIECIYRIAESRGQLRQELFHAPERRQRCGCRKNVRGQCHDGCEQSSLHLFSELNRTMGGMHFTPRLHYTSLRFDEATGDLVHDHVTVDDGWNGMSTAASVDCTIHEMNQLVVGGSAMPPHPDESLWLSLGEQKLAALEEQRLWRQHERAAGRNGLTAGERHERAENMRRASSLWGEISCFANPLRPTLAEVASNDERTPWMFRMFGHRSLLQIQFAWRRKLLWTSTPHSSLRLKLLCKLLFVRNAWFSPKHMHCVRSNETMQKMVLGL